MTANAQLASFDGAFGTKDYKYLVGTCAHCGDEGKLLRFADFTICTGNKKLLGLDITCRQAGAAAVTAAREGRGKKPIVHAKRRKTATGVMPEEH